MNSQEELAGWLRLLTDALASNHARRLSIVRDGDKPRVACFEPGFAARIELCPEAPRKRATAYRIVR
jgi:hypothetical protein